MDPPLGGVGNTLAGLCWCGGVVVAEVCEWKSLVGSDESSPLEIDEMGLNGGLVAVWCLAEAGLALCTLLKALIRGKELFRSSGLVVVVGNVAVGKYGRLLLFGITSASSPVGRRDGMS